MTGDSPKPPNLDLIGMVQRARMLHDAEAVPSAIGGVYWIEAVPERPAQTPTPRAGFWLIETDAAQLDALWETVKAATRAGSLGYKSKASTAARGSGATGQRVVCVCTIDRADSADVERVRAALAALAALELTPSRYE